VALSELENVPRVTVSPEAPLVELAATWTIAPLPLLPLPST